MASEKVSFSAGNPPEYQGPPPVTSPPGPFNPAPVAMATIIATNVPVGAKSQALVCRSCNKEIVTQIEHKTTTKTHLIAGAFCLCLMWPCALATYLMDSCKSIDHYCPNCQAYIGSYKN